MKYVVLLSGGLDSAVLLYYLKDQGHEVLALSVDYGQRHVKKLEYAGLIAAKAEVELTSVDMSDLAKILKGCSLTDDIEVPDGRPDEESMGLNCVPNRNMILLAMGVSHAISEGAVVVAFGPTKADASAYPDCRAAFVNALSRAAMVCDKKTVTITAPFVNNTKADVVALGHQLGVPFGLTWTCYRGKEEHCGTCGTCIARREAFETANVKDLTVYVELQNKQGEIGAAATAETTHFSSVPQTSRPSAPSGVGEEVDWPNFHFDSEETWGLVGSTEDWDRIISQHGGTLSTILNAREKGTSAPPTFSLRKNANGITLREYFTERGVLDIVAQESRLA